MNEINVTGLEPNLTVYYTIINPLNNYYYNSNSQLFEAFNVSHWGYYSIAMVDGGGGFYYQSFPTAIITAGNFFLTLYAQAASSPADTDNSVASSTFNWTGSSTGNGYDWITLAYLKNYLNITNTNYDTQLAQLISQASWALNNSLQRIITFGIYTEIQDGTGFSFLKSYQYPIQYINSIIGGYQTNSATTYAGTFFVYNDQGSIRWQVNSGECGFCSGFQNYLISYSAGYYTVPLDLQLAACIYVQFLFQFSQLNLLQTNIKNKDITIAYGRSLIGDFSDGIFAPIESILSRYRPAQLL